MNGDRYHARTRQPARQQGSLPSGKITYYDNRGNVVEDDDEYGGYDDSWPPRIPNSNILYVQPFQQGSPQYKVHPVREIPPRTTAKQAPKSTTGKVPVPKKRGWFRAHPILWLGLGMLLMLGLWQGLTMFGNWWTVHQDDVQYGRPRTAQYDVQIGHNDSPTHKTHVIVINLNARLLIIELPGGDSSKAKIYQGPQLFGPNADLDPITATFQDVDGDGRLDMIVHVQGVPIVYLNQKVNGVWQFVQQQSG